MKLPITIILGLTASVSAIDVGLRSRSNCDSRGGGWLCTNLNPNSCCGISSGHVASIIFYAIPTEWSLELRGHDGGNCNRLSTVDGIFGGTERCLNAGWYTGASYVFRSKRRTAQESACTSSVAPDVLFLADGQKYNIVNMDHGLIEELAGFATNGSSVEDIPAVFKPFEIAA
ncbi:hypothetical protein GLAREA_02918 [Glarea lozoyensis ATCC 20868]|uniref:Uncharacterized protein n=2 Tax=Glarea lozoyensis TaxID=101852 RepID=S3CPB8_GLAL2|nr:uncharacterized protein GLAREA_02918 [Glarea lozoyensis ATCC 20868]EHL00657.1 hypothetical protein M7I_3401 [Glarea lozoyensis 74030]EPE27004.1 hypothetical protein GLAREA_02918 [Glarea lozoyensis ATCC 20868]